ncbi:MAG: GNAT family N-acetyltransferase [Chitinophagaceae bacterium]|nr:MAG: GNAT family N-acetyltransferase [Chitinophagaceae bacterium]
MLIWSLKSFEQLTPSELYALLRLRSEVFVVEQNCVFLDMDNQDQDSYHLMGWGAGADNEQEASGSRLLAYTRLVPPGQIYSEMSIGRVVTSPAARGTGAGRALMEESIRRCFALFGSGPIRIGAQQYLERFYASLGFVTVSDPYLEDGIPHVSMLRAVELR